MPFGRFNVRLERIEGGIPQTSGWCGQTRLFVPSLFPCRDRSLLLMKVSDEGLVRAIDGIQAVMLRLLTGIPPGKVRFTIFDPVGLGENFSAFMHLAD